MRRPARAYCPLADPGEEVDMTEGLPNDPLGIRRLRDRRQRFRERARAEYITGAEEEWRGRMGRPMTAEELERVVRPYPGDV